MKKILTILLTLLLISAAGTLRAQPCIGSQSITATPAPNPGNVYFPGTVVTFCYTVSNYSQTGADWLAGIVPTLGPAWDASTIQPVSAAASCDGQGVWGWYGSCTGTASGTTWGPGFYYDSPAGSTSGTLDGIPGNNYGDNCQNNTWTFCFSVEVGPCNPTGSGSLYVGVTALSDYQAGSWGTNACNDPPATFMATVQCCNLTVPNITLVDATCANSNNGSITVNPMGAPPYSYQWSNGATTQTNSNLAPGIYTVTVTDANLCTKDITLAIGSPPAIALNETVVDNQCTTNDGSITLAPTGGVPPFSYQWSNGLTGSAIGSLSGGTYTVTVTDSVNCTTTQTFTISSFVPIVLVTSSTPANCGVSDGSASVAVSGGDPPYTYDWQPAGGNGPVASNLPGGVYTVTVTDTNGCTSVSQVTVQSSATFTLTSSFIPLQCDPNGTTSATVVVNGGTPPFNYQWSPTGGNQATATGLPSGTYMVMVTDSNNCVDSSFVTIPAITAVTAAVSTTPVQCNLPNSGSATATGAGGTGPYSYLWSNASTTSSISGLAGGAYTVTVTDANGCTVTETVTVAVIPDVFVNAGTDQTVCSGTAVNLTGTPSGGTSPFQFAWSNGVSGASQTVNPTTTTIYTVIVTDANGCSASSPVTINVIDYPVVTVSSDVDICFGASTNLLASGGATYSWSPATGLNDPNIPNPVANPNTSTTYTVTVSNGPCSSTGDVTVNVAPEIGASFTVDTSQGQPPLTVTFANNTLSANSWFWDFGDGNTSTDPNPVHIYTESGNYSVVMIAQNAQGCTDTVSYSFIVVDLKSLLIIPNVFTPNGDGFNDTFHFQEESISSISVVIMNRWGKEVYSWSRPEGAWNGKSEDGNELPDGVYLIIVKATGADGKAYDYNGTVQLIRNKK